MVNEAADRVLTDGQKERNTGASHRNPECTLKEER